MNRRVIGVIALAIGGLVLAGCQSTSPILFIATPGYVEAQIAMREEALRQDYDARIVELEQQLSDQQAVADELSGLSDVITEVEASNRELQDLASVVEQELTDLPLETIQIIVDVLTRHLEGNR